MYNPHSNLASFYRYFYLTEKLPNSLCNYCWGLAFAFLMTPFVLPMMLYNRYQKKIYSDTAWGDDTKIVYKIKYNTNHNANGLVINFFLLILGVLAIKVSGEIKTFEILVKFSSSRLINVLSVFTSATLIGYIVAILACIGFIIVARFISYLWGFIPKTKPLTDEEYRKKYQKELERESYRKQNPYLIVLFWRWLVAFKEKNCPIMEWDYSNKEKKIRQ